MSIIFEWILKGEFGSNLIPRTNSRNKDCPSFIKSNMIILLTDVELELFSTMNSTWKINSMFQFMWDTLKYQLT